MTGDNNEREEREALDGVWESFERRTRKGVLLNELTAERRGAQAGNPCVRKKEKHRVRIVFLCCTLHTTTLGKLF